MSSLHAREALARRGDLLMHVHHDEAAANTRNACASRGISIAAVPKRTET